MSEKGKRRMRYQGAKSDARAVIFDEAQSNIDKIPREGNIESHLLFDQ
jgi:hypothetical protein